MKDWWWKILGAAIIFCTIIIGLTTPLKPGITGISPSEFKEGEEASIEVTGYNTHFDETTKNVAYLRLSNGQYIPSKNSIATSYNKIKFDFNLLANMATSDSLSVASLIVSNEIDGSFVLPSAVYFSNDDSINRNQSAQLLNAPSTLYENNTYRFPYRSIINETIRNTFFHVTLWFAMFIMLLISFYYSIQFLRTKEGDFDLRSKSLTTVAVLFGILGLITGSFWAKFAWGTWWTSDVKLNMSAIAMLIYLAYFVLRSSITDQDQEARLAAAFNIFAFVTLIPLIFVIPRMTDSLHPGNGGNPAFGGEDLDNTLRMVFYPAIIGFTLLGLWIATLYYRFIKLDEEIKTDFDNLIG